MMVQWQNIETVLLDMDGTLLDLHYDNHFWLEHVPRRYAEKLGVAYEDARGELAGRYQRVAGTLDWYCVDYWTRELGLDIAALKAEVRHLIAVHPHVPEFLAALRRAGKRTVLVTNAHGKSLDLKFRHTGLGAHLDAVISAHELGLPKEHPPFWERLQAREPFQRETTLFVDDSLPVLRSARSFGIRKLLAVRRPDSRGARKDAEEFPAIDDFGEILPDLAAYGAPT